MNHLEYKGWKSTRLQMIVAVWLMATIFIAVGTIQADHWVDLTKWLIGIYAGSEVGAKGAVALSERKS